MVDAALAVRKVLDAAGAENYCKTSGKTGLHVYVPLGGCCNYDQARQFAEIIARLLIGSCRRSPVWRETRPSGRRRFIWTSCKTGAARPWQRPTRFARIRVPPFQRLCGGKKLQHGLDPSEFTIRTIGKRLEKTGDLWTPVLSGTIDLVKCLQRLG